MTTTVTMGPIPFMQFTDNLGKFAAFGKLYTYNWDTRAPKATYYDPAGLKTRTNPIDLDTIGRVREIFWEVDVAYYLEFRTQTGALIWATDEPYVPASSGGSNVTTNIEIENLFINGQFRFFPIGEYSPLPNSIPNLADGGWSFEKDGTNPLDSFAFRRFTLDNTNVPTSPVFFLNYVADEPGVSETFKDIVFTITDVRTLANETITVGLNARSAIAGTYPIQIKARQVFGTGGSPSASVTTDIVTITPTTTAQTYTGTITLPDLSGKTLGTNEDDKLQILFRLPLNNISNLELVNFYFKRGNAVIDYPYLTSDEVDATIKALAIPDHTRTTDFDTDATVYPTEMAYDAIGLLPVQGVLVPQWLPPVPVGTPLLWMCELVPLGFTLADGSPVLKSGQFNRLYNVPYDMSTKFGERWGRPDNNIFAAAVGAVIDVEVTAPGIANQVSIGTTTFTVFRRTVGFDDANIVAESIIGGNQITFVNSANGAFTPPVIADTSNLTFTAISNGSVSTKAQWQVTAKAANLLVGGDYFRYSTTGGNWLIYFVIDGVGTDPAVPSYTSHAVYLKSTDTDVDVATYLARAVPGWESSNLTCTSGSVLSPGDYIEVGIVGANYALWYAIDGAGAPPSLPSVTNVRIDISSTDSDTQVATKTADAMNPLLWNKPDTLGLFPRFWNDGSVRDPDAATRTALLTGYPTGDHVGSYQADEFKTHQHGVPVSGGQGGGQGLDQGIAPFGFIPSQATGGAETRPKNFYFALIIKF